MNHKPHRRWYQFSLLTMLIVMVLSSVAFGWWAQRSREWIKQRHETLNSFDTINYSEYDGTPAPAGLWLFGEQGIGKISCSRREDLERMKRLFPEAETTQRAVYSSY